MTAVISVVVRMCAGPLLPGVIRTLAAGESIADTGFCHFLSGVYWDEPWIKTLHGYLAMYFKTFAMFSLCLLGKSIKLLHMI